MKTIKITLAALLLTFFSCGDSKPDEPTTPAEETKYQIDTESVVLKWTAYKTTAKKGVNGEFGKIRVKDFGLGDSPEQSINEVGFSVPVSSLFTGDASRDYKLINLFFGVMDQTEFITGTFHKPEGDSKSGHGVMDLTMNGKKCDLPYDYTIARDSMFIETHLNILSWDGKEALDSINEACKDLHKGADGISKTWSEVDIKASYAILKK